jgi:hypothetical protein
MIEIYQLTKVLEKLMAKIDTIIAQNETIIAQNNQRSAGDISKNTDVVYTGLGAYYYNPDPQIPKVHPTCAENIPFEL